MKYNIGETHHINGIECKVANISNGFIYFRDMNDEYVGCIFNEENEEE